MADDLIKQKIKDEIRLLLMRYSGVFSVATLCVIIREIINRCCGG